MPVSFLSWTNAGRFRANLISTYRHDPGSDVLFHGKGIDFVGEVLLSNCKICYEAVSC